MAKIENLHENAAWNLSCTPVNSAAHSRAKNMRPVAMRNIPLIAKNGKPRITNGFRVVAIAGIAEEGRLNDKDD